MPLNAIGWSTEEDEKLIELVEPHAHLYNVKVVKDQSRKNILARETTWQEIAQQISKPVEECRKRWRGIRDSYARRKRLGSMPVYNRLGVYNKLMFLDDIAIDNMEEMEPDESIEIIETKLESEQVITDTQEYYEIRLLNNGDIQNKQLIKILPKVDNSSSNSCPPKKIGKKNCGRKKSVPIPRDVPPVKILPKPMIVNGPKLVQYVEDQNQPVVSRTQTIDKLIERILKENTNEIDVFFRSMAASVKKLPPNLIPKVKMEVCNVIAKYEMQSFDKNLNI